METSDIIDLTKSGIITVFVLIYMTFCITAVVTTWGKIISPYGVIIIVANPPTLQV